MKFLEIPQLGLLASRLSNSSHSVRVTTRIEAYSCKSVASERKMMKSLDQEFTTDLQLSSSSSSIDPPISSSSLDSAFGRLDRKECRKTFWLLIATLNAAYPDHNFSRIKAEDFHIEPPRTVLTKLSEALELDRSGSDFASTLGALSTSPECIPKNCSNIFQNPTHLDHSLLTAVHPLIAQVLDPIIDLANCQVYSYSPDPDSDPHAVVSDDEDCNESLPYSIYHSNRLGTIQDFPIHHPSQDTMWEIEGVDTPLYLYSDRPTHLPSDSFNLPSRSISATSPSPHLLFPQQRTERFIRSPPQPDSSPLNSPIHPEHHPSSPSALSKSPESNYEEEESAGGLLWSSHYFFHNRKKKRILFISTWGRKALMSSSLDESWNKYQEGHEVNHSSNSLNDLSPSMLAQMRLRENSIHVTKPKDNNLITNTSLGKSHQPPSNLKRNLASNLSKQVDLTHEHQSPKSSLDPSGDTASVSVSSRPLKKKRSKLHQ